MNSISFRDALPKVSQRHPALIEYLIFIFVLLTLSSEAVADNFSVGLSIAQPVSLDESTQMDLGAILTDDNTSCTLGWGGVRFGAACMGTAKGTLAMINVSGTAGMQVDIELEEGGSKGAEMSFEPIVVDNGQNAETLTGITLQENHTLALGGILTVLRGEQAIANNIATVDYQVEVTYQ